MRLISTTVGGNPAVFLTMARIGISPFGNQAGGSKASLFRIIGDIISTLLVGRAGERGLYLAVWTDCTSLPLSPSLPPPFPTFSKSVISLRFLRRRRRRQMHFRLARRRRRLCRMLPFWSGAVRTKGRQLN